MCILSLQPINEHDMRVEKLSPDLIILYIDELVDKVGGDYSTWIIGRRESPLVAVLAGERSIAVLDSWNCRSVDGDKVVRYFLDKGMTLDDGILHMNGANGVYVRRD